MTDKELYRQIESDDDSDLLKELRKKMNLELEKPFNDRNLDYIEDLAKTIDEITDGKNATAEVADRGIRVIKTELHKAMRKSRMKHLRWWIPAACLFLIIGTNIWTYTAFGMNAFSAAYQVLNGGINVDLNSRDSTEVYTGNPYADDMQRICIENNLDVLIPAYIPEGFQSTEFYGYLNCSSEKTQILFNFCKSNRKLNIAVTFFPETSDLPPIGIPTEHYEISEQVIQDTPITVIKEDEQYTAAFTINRTQYLIYADHLDYDECQRVLYSFFE